jgi:hypothetical protein
LSEAWKKVLSDGVVNFTPRADVAPLALANNGRYFYASLHSKEVSGIARIPAKGGRYELIRRYPDPTNDGALGSFDGRWLVWDEYHSLNGLDDFAVWSWDSQSGRLRQIGKATRSPSGEFWPSPWRQADVRDGFATWAQGVGEDGLADVHVVDLASGRDRIVRRGHLQAPFFVPGQIVVWPESMKPGALTVMKAADVRTGRPAAVPIALRHVRGALVPVTDGRAIAYASDRWRSLWWSPSLETAPRRVFVAPKGDYIQNWVHVAGRFVSFTVWDRAYLADAQSGRYLEVSPGGETVLGTTSLALSKPPTTKTAHPITDLVFLRLKSLPPIPPCN